MFNCFRPGTESLPHLWELGTDYYLHFSSEYKSAADYCAWFCYDDREVGDELGEILRCTDGGSDSNSHSSRVLSSFYQIYRQIINPFVRLFHICII